MATMLLIACWHAETNLADAGRMGDQVRRILGKEGSQTCIYRSIGRQRMAMATPQPISCKGWGTWPDLVQETTVHPRRLSFPKSS